MVVLLDRFVDSSLAYQGAGRALGVQQVRAINLFATGDLQPDRTLLLRISPAAGRARQRERASEPDRLEREGEGFFAAIAAAYDELARAEPERIRTIDATQPPEQVLRDALAAIEDLLRARRPPAASMSAAIVAAARHTTSFSAGAIAIAARRRAAHARLRRLGDRAAARVRAPLDALPAPRDRRGRLARLGDVGRIRRLAAARRS